MTILENVHLSAYVINVVFLRIFSKYIFANIRQLHTFDFMKHFDTVRSLKWPWCKRDFNISDKKKTYCDKFYFCYLVFKLFFAWNLDVFCFRHKRWTFVTDNTRSSISGFFFIGCSSRLHYSENKGLQNFGLSYERGMDFSGRSR